MLRILLILPFLALSLLAAPEPVVVPGHFDLKNATDPVDGKKVKKGLHNDWMGVRVHFADFKNIETLRKDAKKYVGKLGIALVEEKDKQPVLDLQNKKCPVQPSKDAEAKRFVEKNGVRVRVCCGKCAKRVKQHWNKVAKPLGYEWIPPVIDLRNTKCPVTGDKCYPSAPIWFDVDGIRIRVCCDHCAEEIPENKERVFRALGVDPAKLKARLIPSK